VHARQRLFFALIPFLLCVAVALLNHVTS